MSSTVISFRLSDLEIQALKALQAESSESLNQTAARLLRSILGGTASVNNTVDIVDLRTLIKLEVEAAVANSQHMKDLLEEHTVYLTTAINEIKQEVNERLGELGY
ncbi:hypothetical protein [Nostoc sp. FACHB-888]|uniref:hypothetical protein n=1 Tax=Nostoc sp. FACHB-888 TaxID=2692842 RepID=UPI0016877C3B|nr:hypothetical protein [Nostoc sp. FACHB-888]MBD2247048.1 hypothetical protein [Nostoc sp. FACHB-888]